MLRLREIEHSTAELESTLREAWDALAVECASDPDRFRASGHACAGIRFDDSTTSSSATTSGTRGVAPADGPAEGDYALVNGRDYRLEPFDARWVLERFPAELAARHARLALTNASMASRSSPCTSRRTRSPSRSRGR
jgi:hypothetical protein